MMPERQREKNSPTPMMSGGRINKIDFAIFPGRTRPFSVSRTVPVVMKSSRLWPENNQGSVEISFRES